jgi:hypothetical protein
MECPIAGNLLEAYSKTARDYFEATVGLANLTRQHALFAEGERAAKEKYAEYRAAHLALNTIGQSMDAVRK